jgi:predicted acyl esterase
VPSLYADELQAMAAPPDDRLVEDRPDVATFTSEPFPAGLRIAGPALVRLGIGAAAASATTTAKLLEVSPDGTTRRLRDGAARHLGDSADRPVVVDLGAVAHQLAPGNRLRLEVAASAFPQLLPDDGSADPWTASTRSEAARSLRVGGAAGSTLTLTILASNQS